MTNRRGMALLAALWFVVAIATVGLALGLETMEHRRIGVAAADQRAEAAATTGGLAIALGRLDRALRQVPRANGSAVDRLRASDPWIDADSLFPDPLRAGNVKVYVHAEDLQAKLNINTIAVPELRTFLGLVLQDYGAADALAQAIDDWRDRDDRRQSRGAERDDYLARRQLDLPTNRGGFRDLEELRSVQGMTPAVFTRIRPHLQTGGDRININTAPAMVLRALPGMTDAMVTRILAVRSQHQRITSLEELGGGAAALGDGRVTFSTSQLELTITAVLPPPARPMRQVWTIVRSEDRAVVQWTDGAS